MDRFVHLFIAKDRVQAITAINEFARKRNLIIISTSLCREEGQFYTMVVFEKTK